MTTYGKALQTMQSLHKRYPKVEFYIAIVSTLTLLLLIFSLIKGGMD